MPDVFGPFQTSVWQQAGWFRDAWARSNGGVFGAAFASAAAGDLALTVSGLTATMALGRAHVRGASYERTGTAWSYAVPANTNPTQARIDRLVLRRDLTAQTVVPLVLQGTPAASPVAPALTQVDDGVWDLPLFSFTVPANSAAPLTNIVDERVSGRPPRSWGSWARAVLPTAADGAVVGDTLWSTLFGCMLVRDATTWRQLALAYTQTSAGGITGYDATARAAGVTSFHNGFQVFDSSLNRLYASDGGTVWLLIGGANGAWQSSITAAAGWTVVGTFSNLGNGTARVYLEATKTGTALTVSVTGDVTNTAVATLPAGWESEAVSPLSMAAAGRVAQGAIATGSTAISLAAVAPGANIAVGEVISLTGIYPLNDPTATAV